jgi:hypothetical protein
MSARHRNRRETSFVVCKIPSYGFLDPTGIVATRANAPMRIDGMLDEPIWRFVRPSTNFVQKDPTEGAPATLVTDVRMIITDDAVVIGARMQDDYRAVLSALGPPTDGAAGGYLDDYFEIQIDPHRQHLTSFAFNVAPSGNRRAWIVGQDGTRDESWDFHPRGIHAGTVGSRGYVATG